jgi:DNA-binding response OmpR family regulator
MHVLIIEPDLPLGAFLRRRLEAEGHATEVAGDPAAARELLLASEPDIVILDLDLSEGAGISLLRLTRTLKSLAGLVVLTSSQKAEDRVAALDEGGDDCLVKPFSVAELCARVRAVQRRRQAGSNTRLRIADLELNRIERRVMRSGRAIELTQREFALLEFLMCNAGRPLARTAILEKVWNCGFEGNTNLVDVYVNYLRKKIDEGFTPKLIHTVRGVGYQLSKDAAEESPDRFLEAPQIDSVSEVLSNPDEGGRSGSDHISVP